MIIGIGNDICNIERIEQSLARFGARFENRVFTEAEQAKAKRRAGGGKRNGMASTYAKRFAAKEAFGKALGTGVGAGGGIFWRDIEVVNLPTGQPTIQLHGTAARVLDALTPAGHETRIHLTLTDEYPNAQAFVIIEAIPTSPASTLPAVIT
ncbi:MAG: holo-ACP synthase [Rhodospirillales bacterium 12-54-5]|nr:MAG: holo-ACP synthase [Rhodospirillales bacterium 12-54-5]